MPPTLYVSSVLMGLCRLLTCRVWAFFFVFVAFSACTTPPETHSSAPTAWGDVITLGSAEQTQAPALSALPERVTLAWVGASPSGVEHDIVVLVDQQQTPIVTLPLSPTFPHSSRLFQAAGRVNHHLLWLDVDGYGDSQLFTAVVDETLGVFRGPLPVSQLRATCYDGFARDDGSVWVVWYGGEPTNLSLYSATIEPTGLVLRQQQVMLGGGCPTAVQTFEREYLLWVDDTDVFTAQFLNGFISDPLLVGRLPSLADADRLRSLQAGSDGERVYAFYNITRGDGTDETWFASGMPESVWDAPRRLTALPDETTRFETTFNTGATFAAEEGFGGLAAAWAAPLHGVSPVLPVAVEMDGDALGIMYLQGGSVVGYQQITEINALLGTPKLHTDRDRHLYLVWSEPSPLGAADMRFTSTKNLLD